MEHPTPDRAAAEDPALNEQEMLLLLRDPNADARLLRRVGRDPRWNRYVEVRRAIVLHSRVPEAVAQSLVPLLHWRLLAELTHAPRARPSLRRTAEGILRVRAQELSTGERVALARIASRPLIAVLSASTEPGILRALLGNPRFVEKDAVRIARGSNTPPDLLAVLAEHADWGERRAVALALASNPRTPVPVALGVLRKLDLRELGRLSENVEVPPIVRIGAERLLQAGAVVGGA